MRSLADRLPDAAQLRLALAPVGSAGEDPFPAGLDFIDGAQAIQDLRPCGRDRQRVDDAAQEQIAIPFEAAPKAGRIVQKGR